MRVRALAVSTTILASTRKPLLIRWWCTAPTATGCEWKAILLDSPIGKNQDRRAGGRRVRADHHVFDGLPEVGLGGFIGTVNSLCGETGAIQRQQGGKLALGQHRR